ncbi:hypothetical protein BS78_05G108300 [Paspalum vaginatum]|nr:hypothetical protein BS78_05G108300 [Paspalum vaginatum]
MQTTVVEVCAWVRGARRGVCRGWRWRLSGLFVTIPTTIVVVIKVPVGSAVDCESCIGNRRHTGGCKLLQGLSNATNLELTVPFAKFTDRLGYPEFSKLKTLFLSEWCVASELGSLICILQCSPILEKLTIQLNKTQVLKNTTELEENPHPLLQLSSVSENLKSVKVKCTEVDETVSGISKLFSSLGKQINIEIGL